MNRKAMIVGAGLAMVLALGGCDKKADTPAPAPVASPHAPSGQGMMMPVGETKIVVPDTVKAKWNAVIISIENKADNTTRDVTIKLGSEYQIPGSSLKIKVGDFLPDFRMDGLTITSASDNMANPAVAVKVFDGDRQIFPENGKKWGWLYSKFPTIHPFQHEKYGLALKDAVKTGGKG